MRTKEQIKDKNAYMLIDILDELTPPAESKEQAKASLELVFKHLLNRDPDLLQLGQYGYNTLFFIDEAKAKYQALLKQPETERDYIKAKEDINTTFEMGFSYLDLIIL